MRRTSSQSREHWHLSSQKNQGGFVQSLRDEPEAAGMTVKAGQLCPIPADDLVEAKFRNIQNDEILNDIASRRRKQQIDSFIPTLNKRASAHKSWWSYPSQGLVFCVTFPSINCSDSKRQLASSAV